MPLDWLGHAWEFVKGTPTQVVRSVQIPPDRVRESGDPPTRFEPEKHYFSVVVNEMFLAKSRQWFSAYDPMAIVVSEFTYDGKPIVVPFVAGPSLLEGKVATAQVPNGIAITDTHAAGPYPYNGGKLALTMILAQVKRDSYAKRVLKVVESVGGAFPTGTVLEPYLKVSSAVLDGLEVLFGMGDTVPLAGHRWEFDPGTTPWFDPGFFALINADEKAIGREQLSVLRGRLQYQGESLAEGARHRDREHDYLLYSVRPFDKRTDLTQLPFHKLFQSALKEAAAADDGAWLRAKAGLVALHQAMLASPDLTWDQLDPVLDDYTARIRKAHDRAAGFSVLSTGAGTPPPNVEERHRRLREIHQLLDLP